MKNQTTRPYRKLLPKDLIRMPWKNGGGITTEIAKGGQYSNDGDWGWRISKAVVATDGPFSIFGGIDRTISIIEGSGMDLYYQDGRQIALNLFEVVEFDGGIALEGKLRDGPIKNVNVMVDQNSISANLQIHNGNTTVEAVVENNALVLIHLLAGEGSQIVCSQNIVDLKPNETIIYRNNEILKICSSEDALLAITRINKKNN